MITDAQMTSVARTVREHMPEVHSSTAMLGPAPLVAAVAVYRLRVRKVLDEFRSGRAPTAMYMQRTERYGPGLVHYFHEVELYGEPEGQLVERVTIPWSHDATVVSARASWNQKQLLASSSWRVV